jgi:hypothetical protein
MKTPRQRWLMAGALVILLVTTPSVWAQGLHVTPEPIPPSKWVDFGTVYIGQSKIQPFTIQNTGGGLVNVTNLQIWNMWQTPYTLDSPPSLPYLLGSGETMTVIVRFAPPDFSFWDGKLKIYSDSPVTPYIEVALQGFGDFPPVDPCSSQGLTTCNGVCVNTGADPANCGGCGNVCPPPVGGQATCVSGVCGCDCGPGGTVCAGVCANTTTDPKNCGRCGVVCPDPLGGVALCTSGTCVASCPEDKPTVCSGTCVDVQTDPIHCGACGTVCPPPPAYATAVCQAAGCSFVCNAGYVPEGDHCVPEVTDPRPLITDLIAYYLEALWERTIVGHGGLFWARAWNAVLMWRDLVAVLWEYDAGRIDRTCVRLDEALRRFDGLPRPSDFVEGPGTEELTERLMDIKRALNCP